MGKNNISNQSMSLTDDLMSLKDATKYAPNDMGCYQLYRNGKLVYVGKAEDGIRKRFVQYYNGTTCGYTSGSVINLWKDEIQVKWSVYNTRQAVRSCESNWIRAYKPLLNSQSGWGDKNQLNEVGAISSLEVEAVKVMTPEMAIADCVGSAAKSAVKGAVGVTAGLEIVKSIANGDDIDECLGNVASKSCEAAVSAGAGAVAGEVAGFAAVALGAGPIGMGVATLAAAVGASSVVSDCVEGAFDGVKDVVEDAVFGVIDAAESVGDFFRGLFWWV